MCGKVVRWGQDYTGTVDGMHFEINVPPSDASLARLAARIRGVSQAPIGCLDSVVALSDSRIQLKGWAFDPDDPSVEIWVAVYLDGAGVAWFPTGRSRPDVDAAFTIEGDHGFEIIVDAAPGNHTVQAYAIDIDGGANPLIGQGTVQVGTPLGCLDSVVANGRTVVLEGWAFDPDQPDTSINVAVYRNGEGINWFLAGRPRPDVDAVYGIGGNHGFRISVPCPPGAQRFDVYAINVGPAAGNPYFGSGSVTVR